MAFMSLKINDFGKSKILLNFAPFFLSFVYLLAFPNKKSSHTTLLAFEKVQLNLFEGQNMRLRLRRFFSQVLIELLFVVSMCCCLCNHLKN